MSIGYINDSYLQASDFKPCVNNVTDTLTLFNNLGFVVHSEKSVMYPIQKLVFFSFFKLMKLSPEAIKELTTVDHAYNPVSYGSSQLTMTTDASKTGWGCMVDGIPAWSCWTPEEASNHINYLETQAVFR